MAPTRELAMQVAEEAEKLAPSRHFQHRARVRRPAVCGSNSPGFWRGCDLSSARPGRMLDHLARGTITLDKVRYVVLDEADRMLDIGFRPRHRADHAPLPAGPADAAHVGHGCRPTDEAQ